MFRTRKFSIIFFTLSLLLLNSCVVKQTHIYQNHAGNHVEKIFSHIEDLEFPAGPAYAPHSLREHWVAMALLVYFDNHLEYDETEYFLETCRLKLDSFSFNSEKILNIVNNVLNDNIYTEIDGVNLNKFIYFNFVRFLEIRNNDNDLFIFFKEHSKLTLYEIAVAKQ